ncbi:hypothetical protein QFZ24_000719 [Streptomyces phaeochromogenes]|jgi:hypothetical protein|nr:hypothetical protein [Streptomyces phaeochromogenes]
MAPRTALEPPRFARREDRKGYAQRTRLIAPNH